MSDLISRETVIDTLKQTGETKMTKSEAIKELHEIRPRGGIIPQKRAEAIDVAINALEKLEKIKEAFEKWRTESGGYIYADDEATELIRTLNQILRSDEEYE